MLRKPLMLATAAGALIMVQGAAVAQEQCGGIWAAHCNVSKGPKTKSADKAKADANASAIPPNASATGVANANPNSAAATGTTGVDANAAVAAGAGALGATALAGISAGATVKTGSGTTLGTVSQIVKAQDGSVSRVIVTSSSGRSFAVPAARLSVADGVIIATDGSDQ